VEFGYLIFAFEEDCTFVLQIDVNVFLLSQSFLELALVLLVPLLEVGDQELFVAFEIAVQLVDLCFEFLDRD